MFFIFPEGPLHLNSQPNSVGVLAVLNKAATPNCFPKAEQGIFGGDVCFFAALAHGKVVGGSSPPLVGTSQNGDFTLILPFSPVFVAYFQ